jgi:hypothetical protein
VILNELSELRDKRLDSGDRRHHDGRDFADFCRKCLEGHARPAQPKLQRIGRKPESTSGTVHPGAIEKFHVGAQHAARRTVKHGRCQPVPLVVVAETVLVGAIPEVHRLPTTPEGGAVLGQCGSGFRFDFPPVDPATVRLSLGEIATVRLGLQIERVSPHHPAVSLVALSHSGTRNDVLRCHQQIEEAT